MAVDSVDEKLIYLLIHDGIDTNQFGYVGDYLQASYSEQFELFEGFDEVGVLHLMQSNMADLFPRPRG